MSILALTIFMVIVAIALFLGFCLFMAYGKIGDLEKAKANLKDDNSKLSDALVRKGIECANYVRKFGRLGK